MEQNDTLNEHESLQLIHKMISTAKQSIRDNGFLYLFWGWLVFITSLAFYFLLVVLHYKNAGIVWFSMFGGAVVSIVYGLKKKKEQKVKTYADEFLSYLWGAFTVSIWVIIFIFSKAGWTAASYPVIIILYGIGTFVSGGALKFRPLIWGGISCWVIAVAAMFVSMEIQLLLLPLSVLLSYIIPGHMLKAAYKNAIV